MGVFAGPEIVESGLVLSLDAANSKSYPGSGTTWTDLSGRGNTGTLVNGVGYNSGNLGSLVFDGTNDYVEISTRNTNLEFQPTQPFSVFCWIYNLSSNSTGAVIANINDTSPYTGWDIWVESSTQISMHLISSWSANAIKVGVNYDYTSNSNKWTYFGYTYNGSSPSNATDSLNSINFYTNGVLTTAGKTTLTADGFNTTSETTTYNTSQRLRIASRWISGNVSSPRPFSNSIVQIYNRALTAQEIQQNYNATKSRFGL